MKRIHYTLAIAAVLLFALSPVFAGDKDMAKEKTSEKTSGFHQQALCPVMGGEIDSTAYTDIQGQRVYHCCPMCAKKLKADPDKYFEQAAKDSVVFENLQTTCPVSGDKLKDKETSIYYKGRTVYFCCPKCIATFEKSPQKYLKVMDDNMHANTKTEEHSHNMH